MDKRWAKLQTLDGALALHTIWLFGLTLMTCTLHTYLCMTYTAIIIMITVFPIYYGPYSVCKSSILTTANLSFSFFQARSFTRALCIISHTQVNVGFLWYAKDWKKKYFLKLFNSSFNIYLKNGLAIYPNRQTVDFWCLAVTGALGSKDPPLGGVQLRSVHHSQTLIPPGQTQLRSVRGAEETHTKWHQWLRLCSQRLLR